MAVKALIKRVVPETKAREMIPLFRQMRSLAMNQEGYISGETLRNLNNPEEFLVISNWQSSDAWVKWLKSVDRQRIQEQIDALLGGATQYEVFHYGFSSNNAHECAIQWLDLKGLQNLTGGRLQIVPGDPQCHPGQGQLRLGHNEVPLGFVEPHQGTHAGLVLLFHQVPLLLHQLGGGLLQGQLLLGVSIWVTTSCTSDTTWILALSRMRSISKSRARASPWRARVSPPEKMFQRSPTPMLLPKSSPSNPCRPGAPRATTR
jgi:heme oxygenase (mycobilin-producing)